MNTNNNERKEYELINLEVEYPGIKGGVKWAVISDLSMDELMKRYNELLIYTPVILLSQEQGEAFKEFHRNEHKHEMREVRNNISSGYEEGTSESIFSFFSELHTEEDAICSGEAERIRDAIDSLTAVQQRRVKQYFFEGLTFREIAEREGVSYKNVFKSVKASIEKIKKLFE